MSDRTSSLGALACWGRKEGSRTEGDDGNGTEGGDGEMGLWLSLSCRERNREISSRQGGLG